MDITYTQTKHMDYVGFRLSNVAGRLRNIKNVMLNECGISNLTVDSTVGHLIIVSRALWDSDLSKIRPARITLLGNGPYVNLPPHITCIESPSTQEQEEIMRNKIKVDSVASWDGEYAEFAAAISARIVRINHSFVNLNCAHKSVFDLYPLSKYE